MNYASYMYTLCLCMCVYTTKFSTTIPSFGRGGQSPFTSIEDSNHPIHSSTITQKQSNKKWKEEGWLSVGVIAQWQSAGGSSWVQSSAGHLRPLKLSCCDYAHHPLWSCFLCIPLQCAMSYTKVFSKTSTINYIYIHSYIVNWCTQSYLLWVLKNPVFSEHFQHLF